MGDVCDWILSGLAPPMDCQEERPPEREDFQHHRAQSLDILRGLKESESEKITGDSLSSVILLCSQHSSCSWEDTETEVAAWSSEEHREISDQLISVIETRFSPLSRLLTETEARMFRSLLSQLQPSLVQFSRQPGSVASLVWLAHQLLQPGDLDPLVPLLLPHLLHWLDCWLPPTKVSGCHLAAHIALHSSPSQLMFYGRAEVVAEPLTRLLAGSTEVVVLRAAVRPLLALTTVRQGETCPATPGPADSLLAAVISSLELSSDQERREIFCGLARDLLAVLGPGAARWVSALSSLVISMLASFLPAPPASAFSILSWLAGQCPDCVGRETTGLVPAMVRYLYRASWSEETESSHSGAARLADVRRCLETLATCDSETSARLCRGLANTSVNKTFDRLTRDFLVNINL